MHLTEVEKSMSKFSLERQTTIPENLASVFKFFEDPRNLKEITPPWLSFQVVSASDEVMRQGTKIRYKIRWLGLSMRWESLIAEYERDVRFADEMLRGPYKSWYHVHEFKTVANGVEMFDRLEYALPFGPLGRLAHWLVVRRQLRAIFDYREKRIRQIFTR
jgi:ligand-binding SRPBCC domain-containing protein